MRQEEKDKHLYEGRMEDNENRYKKKDI